MKPESIVLGIAGAFFGLIVGWVLGSQQAPGVRARSSDVPSQQASAPQTTRPVLDESQVRALRAEAERDPSSPAPRVQLGNLYFDAERYSEAIEWYEAALKLNPRDVNVSTDLGVSFYYTDQSDRALKQFDRSLSVDPRHAKTILNMGIVRAFGKQDLAGAAAAWERVIQMAPDSPEGQAAKRALEGLKSAHPQTGASPGGAPGTDER